MKAPPFVDQMPSKAWKPIAAERTPGWGNGTEAGSLEEGKRCDLVVFDARDYREIPYHVGVNLTRVVVTDGAVAVDNRLRGA